MHHVVKTNDAKLCSIRLSHENTLFRNINTLMFETLIHIDVMSILYAPVNRNTLKQRLF